jgi:hypothetical protein
MRSGFANAACRVRLLNLKRRFLLLRLEEQRRNPFSMSRASFLEDAVLRHAPKTIAGPGFLNQKLKQLSLGDARIEFGALFNYSTMMI